MGYPPKGRELIKWYLVPFFPTRVLRLHLRDGSSEEYYDNEVEFIHIGKNLSIVKVSAEPYGTKAITIVGGDPWNYSILESPWRLFLSRIMMWLFAWYSVIYFSFLLPTLLEIDLFKYILYDIYLAAIGIYFVMSVRLFRRPSIEFVELHEFGTYGDLRAFVPGPRYQSKLSFEQVMRLVGYVKSEQFTSETLEKLQEDLERLHSENKRLWTALARAEKSASRFYEAALADVLLTAPRDLIENVRKQLAVEYSAKLRLMIVLLVVLVPLAFAVGFLLAGGSIGFEVVKP